MAITKIRGSQIHDYTIAAINLAADSVTTVKIVDANVTVAKLATDSVETIKIKDANVTVAKLATDAVETIKIKDLNVTEAKLAAGAVTSGKIGTGAIGGGTQFASTVDADGKTISGAVTFSGNPLVPNLDPEDVAPTQAVNKAFVDAAILVVSGSVNSLGNAFNYVGSETGAALVGDATDLSLLAAGGKNAGDYYKVTTAGYFKVGAGAAFFANVNDGLVWNLSGTVDVIDNTNASVSGTADYIALSGSLDTGYTVDVATALKTRISTLETEAGNAQDACGLSGTGTLAAYSGTTYLDAVTTLKAATIALDTRANADATAIGVVANLTTTATNLVAAINEVSAKGPSSTFVRKALTVTGLTAILDIADLTLAGDAIDTLQVFLNGVLQELTDDYTFVAATGLVTLGYTPFLGDKVTVTYFKSLEI